MVDCCFHSLHLPVKKRRSSLDVKYSKNHNFSSQWSDGTITQQLQ